MIWPICLTRASCLATWKGMLSPDNVSCPRRPRHLPSKACEHAVPSAWIPSLVLSSHLSWSLPATLQILTQTLSKMSSRVSQDAFNMVSAAETQEARDGSTKLISLPLAPRLLSRKSSHTCPTLCSSVSAGLCPCCSLCWGSLVLFSPSHLWQTPIYHGSA